MLSVVLFLTTLSHCVLLLCFLYSPLLSLFLPALVNYYNRNASSPMTNETLAISYGAAVGSALTVAFGLAKLIQRRYDPATAKSLLRWVAFPSAVVASSLNCYIVRSPA